MLTSELHFKRIFFSKVFLNGLIPCFSSLRDFFCLCQFLMDLLHGLWALQIGKAGRVGWELEKAQTENGSDGCKEST